jgi:HAE1 family hydrophobic/amphiphilic exporter-1
MNLTRIAIERPSLIIVLFGVLFLGGFVAYRGLGVEMMPDFSQPVITIRTMYPGAAPEEVANSVTRPVEDALSALERVDFISSRSLANASIVIVNFKYGADLDLAMQDAQRRIDNIRQDLPEGLQPPVMSKVSPNDLPIMSLSALSDRPAPEFHQHLVDHLLPRIQQLKGVAEITLLGGEQREVQVKVDQERLLQHRASLSQVSEAILRAGREVPAGPVRNADGQLTVKLAGKLHTVQDVEEVVVAMPAPGSVVRVKDVAHVVDGVADPSSVSRYNGREGIGLLIKKQGDANAVDMSAAVRAELSRIEVEEAAQHTRFIIASDSTDTTLEAVNAVLFDLGLAIVLVSIVMLLFLRSLRNSLIVLVAIPASLVSAFVAMGLLRLHAEPDDPAGHVAHHRHPGGRQHRGAGEHPALPGQRHGQARSSPHRPRGDRLLGPVHHPGGRGGVPTHHLRAGLRGRPAQAVQRGGGRLHAHEPLRQLHAHPLARLAHRQA